MATKRKYVLITADSPMFSCEVKVTERRSVAVLKRIKRIHEFYKLRNCEDIKLQGQWVRSLRRLVYKFVDDEGNPISLKQARCKASNYTGKLSVNIKPL